MEDDVFDEADTKPARAKIIDKFPFETIRDQQHHIASELEKVWDNPKIKYIIIEAPTGVGKSPMVVAAARSSRGGAYIGTVNIVLQDQYNRDFASYLNDLKGRSNYPCAKDSHLNAGNAECAESQLPPSCSSRCEYYIRRKAAIKGPITIMNFHALIMQLNSTGFESRETILVDEAHNLINVITDIGSFKVDPDGLKDLGIFVTLPNTDSMQNYIVLAKSIRRQINEIIEINNGAPDKFKKDFKELAFSTATFLQEYIDSSEIPLIDFKDDDNPTEQVEEDADETAKKKKPKKKVKTFKLGSMQEVENPNDVTIRGSLNHVILRSETEFGTPLVSIKPIEIKELIGRYLLRFANQRLIMLSATILDFDTFMDMNGFERENTHIIKLDSSFPVNNSPIFFKYNIGNINKDNLKANLPVLTSRVDLIAGHYADKKGIIHSHTYEIANYIYENSKLQSRILFPKSAKQQKEMMERHFESKKPTILLSPSMTEGVDLKGALSEFQIFCKVPFPYFGDPLMRARMEKYPNYANMLTAIGLVQSFGRSIRSETDVAYSFMLDGVFNFWVSKNRSILPKGYLESIQWK